MPTPWRSRLVRSRSARSCFLCRTTLDPAAASLLIRWRACGPGRPIVVSFGYFHVYTCGPAMLTVLADRRDREAPGPDRRASTRGRRRPSGPTGPEPPEDPPA